MDMKKHLTSLYGNREIEPFVELERPHDNFIVNNGVPWQRVSRNYIIDLVNDENSCHSRDMFIELSDESIDLIRRNMENMQDNIMNDLDEQARNLIIEQAVYDLLSDVTKNDYGVAPSMFFSNFTYEIFSLMTDYKIEGLVDKLKVIYDDFIKAVNENANNTTMIYEICNIYNKRINSLSEEDNNEK